MLDNQDTSRVGHVIDLSAIVNTSA
jgi:hypothetical protein